MRTTPLSALILLAAVACTDDSAKTDDSSSGPWCDSMDGADTYYIEGTGGSATSGAVEGRFITDASGDLHDPTLIGNIEFQLESVDAGGTNLNGETDEYGEWSRTLGEGTWQVQSSGSRSGYDCAAEFTFEVTAGKKTYVCVDAKCAE